MSFIELDTISKAHISMFPPLLGIAFIVWYLCHAIHFRYRRLLFQKKHPCVEARRMPQGLDILGLGVTLGRTKAALKHRVLSREIESHQTYGRTYSFLSGGRTVIRTIEPDNVKTILATKFEDYNLGEARMRFMGPLLGKGIFTADGKDWNRSRTLLRPTFKTAHVANMSTYEAHVQNIISLIPNNEVFDIAPLFSRLAMDVSTELLLGESLQSLRSSQESLFEAFAEAFDYSQEQVVYRSRLGKLARFHRNPRCDEAHRTVHSFVDGFVEKAVAAHREGTLKSERYCFLHELVRRTDDVVEIRHEMLNVLLAGRDTTATVLSHIFFAVAKRRDVWQKLRAEINTLDNQKLEYENLRNLKYLRYVINEVMRLWPLIPVNTRKAVRDTVLPLGGGPDGKDAIHVPRGTTVRYSVYAMHREEEIFGEDANVFNPDRWEALRPGWGYIPFNGGPRICVGQKFALNEIMYTVVRIMQEFPFIKSEDPGEWVEQQLITLRSRNGVKISLSRART